MLPDDLYLKLGDRGGSAPAMGKNSRKTNFKIGDTFYNIDVSTIPYLSSFISFQRLAQPQNTEFVHRNITLFDVALKGLESGYRHYFRSLRGDIPQYHTLCETYDFLGVDILTG